MRTGLVSGQPGAHWVLLFPGGFSLCDIQPCGLHGHPDHNLLQAPRRHGGPGGPHHLHHHHHRHVRLQLQLQAEPSLSMEISAERLLDIPLLADCVPQRDSVGGEPVQELG